MKRTPLKIVSIAAALAALSGAVSTNAAEGAVNVPEANQAQNPHQDRATTVTPNVLMPVGSDLLGLVVTKGADGVVVADHYSHVSHSSHSSHRSHYSAVI